MKFERKKLMKEGILTLGLLDFAKKILVSGLLFSVSSLLASENIQTTTIDQDKLMVVKEPYLAERIADKWYNKGNKEFALELDRLVARGSYWMAHDIADKWYDRGYEELALEFDELCVEYVDNANKIANKWQTRGHKAIAIKFDRMYVENFPFSTQECIDIADKWWELDEQELAIEFYKIMIFKSSARYLAGRIADKCYEHGYHELAFEFDKIYVVYSRPCPEVAKKWYERKYREIALEFDKLCLFLQEVFSDEKYEIIEQWYQQSEIKIGLALKKLCARKYVSKLDSANRNDRIELFDDLLMELEGLYYNESMDRYHRDTDYLTNMLNYSDNISDIRLY